MVLGAVRITGHRDGAAQGADLELTVDERLAVNGRDLDPDAAALRSVSALVSCTRCMHSMAVELVEDDGTVELSLRPMLG